MSNNSDKAAYARPASSSSGSNLQQDGLTKRELIAAMVMQGMLSNSSVVESIALSDKGADYDYLCRQSIKAADTLLNELEKPQPNAK